MALVASLHRKHLHFSDTKGRRRSSVRLSFEGAAFSICGPILVPKRDPPHLRNRAVGSRRNWAFSSILVNTKDILEENRFNCGTSTRMLVHLLVLWWKERACVHRCMRVAHRHKWKGKDNTNEVHKRLGLCMECLVHTMTMLYTRGEEVCVHQSFHHRMAIFRWMNGPTKLLSLVN